MKPILSWKVANAVQTRGQSPLGDTDPAQPVEMPLRPQSARWVVLAFLVPFTLLWNGFIGFMGYQMFAGGPGGWMGLFLLPFVAAGIALIVLTLYQLLSLFNPKPVLTIDPAQPRLGDTVRLEWRLEGRPGRLHSLHIELVGAEASTYRRGTSTYTDRETFAEIPIVDIPATPQRFSATALSGEATFAIPAATMHTLEAPSNKVTWTLKVKGDIPRWPDLKDEFPIVIVPAEVQP